MYKSNSIQEKNLKGQNNKSLQILKKDHTSRSKKEQAGSNLGNNAYKNSKKLETPQKKTSQSQTNNHESLNQKKQNPHPNCSVQNKKSTLTYKKHIKTQGQSSFDRLKNKLCSIINLYNEQEEVLSVSYYHQSSRRLTSSSKSNSSSQSITNRSNQRDDLVERKKAKNEDDQPGSLKQAQKAKDKKCQQQIISSPRNHQQTQKKQTSKKYLFYQQNTPKKSKQHQYTKKSFVKLKRQEQPKSIVDKRIQKIYAEHIKPVRKQSEEKVSSKYRSESNNNKQSNEKIESKSKINDSQSLSNNLKKSLNKDIKNNQQIKRKDQSLKKKSIQIVNQKNKCNEQNEQRQIKLSEKEQQRKAKISSIKKQSKQLPSKQNNKQIKAKNIPIKQIAKNKQKAVNDQRQLISRNNKQIEKKHASSNFQIRLQKINNHQQKKASITQSLLNQQSKHKQSNQKVRKQAYDTKTKERQRVQPIIIQQNYEYLQNIRKQAIPKEYGSTKTQNKRKNDRYNNYQKRNKQPQTQFSKNDNVGPSMATSIQSPILSRNNQYKGYTNAIDKKTLKQASEAQTSISNLKTLKNAVPLGFSQKNKLSLQSPQFFSKKAPKFSFKDSYSPKQNHQNPYSDPNYIDQQLLNIMSDNQKIIQKQKYQNSISQKQSLRHLSPRNMDSMQQMSTKRSHNMPLIENSRRRIKTELDYHYQQPSYLSQKQKKQLQLLKQRQEDMINKLRREMRVEYKPQIKNTQNLKHYYQSQRYDSQTNHHQRDQQYLYGDAAASLEKDISPKVVFNVKRVNPFSYSTQIDKNINKPQNLSRISYEEPNKKGQHLKQRSQKQFYESNIKYQRYNNDDPSNINKKQYWSRYQRPYDASNEQIQPKRILRKPINADQKLLRLKKLVEQM